MLDLDERLRVTARHATSGLDVHDPSVDVVVLAPNGPPQHARGRQRLMRASVAVTAAAAVVLGVVVWTDADDTRIVPAVGDAPTASDTTETSLPGIDATPAERLRAAVDATLASSSFQVRTAAVDPQRGPIEALSQESPLPLVAGASQFGDLVHIVSGDLVATAWSAGPRASEVLTIRDRSSGLSYWKVGPDSWERAPMEETTVVDLLDQFGGSTCVDQPDTAVPLILVVSTTDGPCPADPVEEGPRRQQWTVSLRPDGRIGTIVPVRDDEPVVDFRSDQTFGGYDGAGVSLADLEFTDVPTPLGASFDSQTGYAKPMYTNG